MSVYISFMVFSFTSTTHAASPSVQQQLIQLADTKTSGKYTFSRCRTLQKKSFNHANKKKKVLIIGDSQACDFLNGMLENGYLKNAQIRVRFIPYRCQPVLSSNMAQFRSPKDQAYCNLNKVDNLDKARKHISEANVIIFAARWKIKSARALPQTIQHLKFKSNQKVIVIGNNNYGNIRIRKYIHMSDNELKNIRNVTDIREQKINNILQRGLGGQIAFIDQHKIICNTDKTCPIFVDGLKLISYDGRHLTKSGARYVGRILYQRTPLKHAL